MIGTDVHKLDKPTDTTVEEQLWYEVNRLKAEVHGLRKANTNLTSELKKTRRQLNKKNKQDRKERKPHFKNGKRGTFKNGG